MEITVKDKAEEVWANFDTLRVLVDATDSKVSFFIREKSLFGAYTEIIQYYAQSIQTLLGVLEDYIREMEKEQGEVVHLLSSSQTEVSA